MNRKPEFIIKTLLVSALVSLFTSCIGIETVIQLKNENSGEVSIKYMVSKMVLNTAGIDEDNSFLPLPVDEKDFAEKADGNDNLRLISYKKEENDEQLFINVKYAFDDISGLNAIMSNSDGENITVSKKINSTVFIQKLYNGNGGKIDQETLDVISDLFSNYPVKITLIAPSDIKETNMGTFSNNKSELSMTLPEVLSSEEPVVMEIIW